MLRTGPQDLKRAWLWTDWEVTELRRQLEGLRLVGKGKRRLAGATKPGAKKSLGGGARSERLGC